MPGITLRIETAADIAAVAEYQKATQKAIDVTKSMGKDTTNLEAQLKAATEALNGEATAAVREAAALEKLISAKRKLGADTSAEEGAYYNNPIGQKRLAQAGADQEALLERQRRQDVWTVMQEDNQRALDFAASIKQTAGAHEVAGAAAAKHATSARMVHQALHGIAYETGPLVARVLSHGLAEGFTLATLKSGLYLTAIYAGIEAIKRYKEENEAFIKEMNQWPQWAERGVDAMKIMRDAMNESRLAASKLRLELDAINKPKSHEAAEEERIKRENDIHAIKERFDDAEYNLAKAHIEATYTDEVQKRMALYQLEEAHLRRKQSDADAADKRSIEELTRKRNTAQKDADVLDPQVAAARKNAVDASGKVKRIEEEIKKADETIKTSEEAAKKIEDEIDAKFSQREKEVLAGTKGDFAGFSNYNLPNLPSLSGMSFSSYQRWYAKMQEVEQLRSIASQSKGEKKKAEERLPGLMEADEKAKFELDALQGDLKTARTKLKEFGEALGTATAELKPKAEGRRQETSMNVQAEEEKQLGDARKELQALKDKGQKSGVLTPDEVKRQAELEKQIPGWEKKVKAEQTARKTTPVEPSAEPSQADLDRYHRGVEKVRQTLVQDEIKKQALLAQMQNPGYSPAVRGRMQGDVEKLDQEMASLSNAYGLSTTVDKTIKLMQQMVSKGKGWESQLAQMEKDIANLYSSVKTSRQND
jgi:hypothetical protein